MTLSSLDRYRPGRLDRLGERAVVLGGSVAGLCAARVLADGFAEVVVVERDSLPDGPAEREGAPQTSHPHALLGAGQATLEDLFPGFGEDLAAEGGLIVDVTRQLVEYQKGGYLAGGDERTPSYCASRPLFEHVVRERLRTREAVRLRDGCQFVGYRTDETETAVTGVTVREDGAVDEIDADLVVDATGRASRTPEWLADHGFAAPPEDRVGIDLQYASLRIERPPGDRRMISVPADPPETRGAVLIPIEGGQWDVLLAEVHADDAPPDREAVLAFADDLPVDLVGDLLRRQRWVSDEVARYPFPASLRRRYEQLDRFPDGLVVTGDAVSSFNPAYGQGMSVAALDAVVLHHALAEGGLDSLPTRFFDRLAPVVDTAWRMATGVDYQYPGTEGEPSLGAKLFNWYFDRLLRAANDDGVLAAAYGEVLDLERSPASLLRPGIVARVFLPIGGDTTETDPPRAAVPSDSDSAGSDPAAAASDTETTISGGDPDPSGVGPSPAADGESAVERERPQRPT
ncbi:FAD-dependent oxidoreductase [Halosimplex halobium]|uniref:FAD-dependent oxidoreductase n=1 Tax=Halosimplex halobium TaxID=3396618 RepID=UPI003F55DA1D